MIWAKGLCALFSKCYTEFSNELGGRGPQTAQYRVYIIRIILLVMDCACVISYRRAKWHHAGPCSARVAYSHKSHEKGFGWRPRAARKRSEWDIMGCLVLQHCHIWLVCTCWQTATNYNHTSCHKGNNYIQITSLIIMWRTVQELNVL